MSKHPTSPAASFTVTLGDVAVTRSLFADRLTVAARRKNLRRLADSKGWSMYKTNGRDEYGFLGNDDHSTVSKPIGLTLDRPKSGGGG